MRWIGLCLLVLLPLREAVAFQDDVDDRVLVHYDFEDDAIVTGPYTLSVFEGAKGQVALTSTFRRSGFRSVEIRDHAGDGEFAELQGYFSDKWSGTLYVRFSILVAEPDEPLNVAFAGHAHFSMREHGLAVWLKTDRGVFYQVTAGVDEPLFEVEPFTWYDVAVAYHVDRGTYDLVIHAEGWEEPVVSRSAQPNVLDVAGSQVRKYSFIGDLPGQDRSNAWFFVDDIVITNDSPVSSDPFVAPGRRMLFVDMHDYYQKRLLERPGCVPVLGYEDFGLSAVDRAELGSFRLDDFLDREAEVPDLSSLSSFLQDRIRAFRAWRRGCLGGDEAVELFQSAAEAVPDARIYPMSEVLALVAAGRWREADPLFLSLYSDWRDDPRFPAIAASIGLARDDLDEAERWLLSSSEVLPSELDHPLVRRLWSGAIEPGLASALEAEFPSDWRDIVGTALTADLRFYVLLWQSRFEEARSFAERMTELLARMRLPAPGWLERQGDAAFREGDYGAARALYEKSLGGREELDGAYLKLSDTHFMLGDFELERHYRERIYGSLRPE